MVESALQQEQGTVRSGQPDLLARLVQARQAAEDPCGGPEQQRYCQPGQRRHLRGVGWAMQRSVPHFPGHGLPGPEHGLRLFPAAMFHGIAALCWRQWQFRVDEAVVKTGVRRILPRGRVHNARGPCPVDGAQAHGAGLAAGVHRAAVQLEGIELGTRRTDRHHFRMGRGVVAAGNAVVALAHHLPVLHDHAAKRPTVAALHAGAGQGDGLAEELLVLLGHGVQGRSGLQWPALELWSADRHDAGSVINTFNQTALISLSCTSMQAPRPTKDSTFPWGWPVRIDAMRTLCCGKCNSLTFSP